jgi:hypothetical protein
MLFIEKIKYRVGVDEYMKKPTRFEVTMKVSPLVHISKSLKNLKAPIADI